LAELLQAQRAWTDGIIASTKVLKTGLNIAHDGLRNAGKCICHKVIVHKWYVWSIYRHPKDKHTIVERVGYK